MITGVSYNVFNGEEHLLPSLRQMRKCVDYINLVVQRISNLGNPANRELEEAVERAQAERLVDRVIW